MYIHIYLRCCICVYIENSSMHSDLGVDRSISHGLIYVYIELYGYTGVNMHIYMASYLRSTRAVMFRHKKLCTMSQHERHHEIQ